MPLKVDSAVGEEDALRADKLRANACVVKPLEFDPFLRVVRSIDESG